MILIFFKSTEEFILPFYLGLSNVPFVKFKLGTLGRNITEGLLYLSQCILGGR